MLNADVKAIYVFNSHKDDPEKGLKCWVTEKIHVSFMIKYITLNGPNFFAERRNSALWSHTKLYHGYLS